jgi:hypothetical protein
MNLIHFLPQNRYGKTVGWTAPDGFFMDEKERSLPNEN